MLNRTDATLGELTDLLKEISSLAGRRRARLSFAIVSPLPREGIANVKRVGVVYTGRPGDDDRKTLRQLNFEPGDFLDVAISV